jgi:prepilin-type N-terminal cleavage/methylation domain-containing protein
MKNSLQRRRRGGTDTTPEFSFHNGRGFTLTELLIAIIIIAITATIFMTTQNASFSRNRSSSRLMDAGQIIEKHIEMKRTEISVNPANLPAKNTVATYTDNDISLVCSTKAAFNPLDSEITNVRQYKIVATWGSIKQGDTLEVTTYLATDF